jgi:hypothetical protein
MLQTFLLTANTVRTERLPVLSMAQVVICIIKYELQVNNFKIVYTRTKNNFETELLKILSTTMKIVCTMVKCVDPWENIKIILNTVLCSSLRHCLLP